MHSPCLEIIKIHLIFTSVYERSIGMYHQIRIRCKLLTNEGSVSSHVQLERHRQASSSIKKEHPWTMTTPNKNRGAAEREVVLPSPRGTLQLLVRSSGIHPCRYRNARRLLLAPWNGWKLPSSPAWSAELHGPGQHQDPPPGPAAVPLQRRPHPRRRSPFTRRRVVPKITLLSWHVVSTPDTDR